MKANLLKQICALLFAVMLFSACGSNEHKAELGKEKVETFTCPMHPQVVQNQMGTCPVCGMDLVPFSKSANEQALHLDERQIALANISTMAVGVAGVDQYTELNGRLIVNPEQTATIASRVAGRLERLYVRQTGEEVRKGQLLYQIYSEQLAALQQEYLVALAQVAQFPEDRTFSQILAAAKQKLLLYGQSGAQVAAIAKSRKTNPIISYHAPQGGTVAELSATEGQYLAEGSPVLRLEGYHSLWVEADVYPREAGAIRVGQQVKVMVPGWEDQVQTVKITFVNPALQAGTQLIQVRGEMPNPQQQWQAGLQAKILIPGKSTPAGLSLPVNAVIRDGKGAHVWIDKGKGKFEPKVVTTGEESAERVVINTGLQAGDRVVISGAYLLYSEYLLKKGKNPMAASAM